MTKPKTLMSTIILKERGVREIRGERGRERERYIVCACEIER